MTIRIGVVGAGENTRTMHIPKLQAIDGVQIVSVCNRSRKSSQRAADEFGIPMVYEDWRELIAADDSDAIVIGTWPYMHCAMTCAALEAGKHVMCEARMATDGVAARMMLAASQQHPDLVAQIVPSPLSFRVDGTIRDLIADGYLGELYSMKVFGTDQDFVDRDAPLHWRHRKELSGLNIMAMGIWYEATMRWVGRATSVYARTRVYVPERVDPETGEKVAIEVPDHVEIVAGLDNGAVANYQFSSVCGLGPAHGAWLFGSEGTLHFELGNGKLLGGRRGDTALAEIEIPPEKAGAWRVEEEFIGAIRGEEPIQLTDFKTGLAYMEFTDAVHRSATTGAEVNLSPRTLGGKS